MRDVGVWSVLHFGGRWYVLEPTERWRLCYYVHGQSNKRGVLPAGRGLWRGQSVRNVYDIAVSELSQCGCTTTGMSVHNEHDIVHGSGRIVLVEWHRRRTVCSLDGRLLVCTGGVLFASRELAAMRERRRVLGDDDLDQRELLPSDHVRNRRRGNAVEHDREHLELRE